MGVSDVGGKGPGGFEPQAGLFCYWAFPVGWMLAPLSQQRRHCLENTPPAACDRNVLSALESTRDWGCGGVKKHAARNS